MRIDYQNLEFIDLTLRELIKSVEDITGFEFTITSLYRLNDDGNHGQLPLRAMDLRCRSYSQGAAIEEYVNDTWIYDPNRSTKKCCIIHDTGHGLHFHFQVHPNTVRK